MMRTDFITEGGQDKIPGFCAKDHETLHLKRTRNDGYPKETPTKLII
jgi:hypothetical protein